MSARPGYPDRLRLATLRPALRARVRPFHRGQSSALAMLGLWGYRQNRRPGDSVGGFWLGLMMLKLHLGFLPLLYAAVQWERAYRSDRNVPRQTWIWAATTAAFYLPGFLLMPDWPVRWLRTPRPLFERALSGFVPRTLSSFFRPETDLYWVSWLLLSALVLLATLALNGPSTSICSSCGVSSPARWCTTTTSSRWCLFCVPDSFNGRPYCSRFPDGG